MWRGQEGGTWSYPMSFQILPIITKSSKSHLQASFTTSQQVGILTGLTCNTAQPRERKGVSLTRRRKVHDFQHPNIEKLGIKRAKRLLQKYLKIQL